MIKPVEPPSCFQSNPSPQSQAENCCHDCRFQIRCLSVSIEKQINERWKRNHAEMAIMWQRLVASSHQHAIDAMNAGLMKRAAYFQRQAARDYKTMWQYLKEAI